MNRDTKLCCQKCAERVRAIAIANGDLELALSTIQFIVCPICYDKQCPKALDHESECTKHEASY